MSSSEKIFLKPATIQLEGTWIPRLNLVCREVVGQEDKGHMKDKFLYFEISESNLTFLQLSKFQMDKSPP